MEWFQLTGDVVAICMCAVTVFLLIKQQLKYRSESSDQRPMKTLKNFSQELTQLVGHPPERVVSSVRDKDLGAFPPENRCLEREFKSRATGGSASGTEAQAKCARDVDEAASSDPYDQVRKLAEMGFDEEEIFKRVDMPKGEIELILKLNRLSAGFGAG